MNDDSIAMHMYWHVLSVLLTGQKKKKNKKKKKKKKKRVTTLRRLQEKGYQATSEPETMSEASYLGCGEKELDCCSVVQSPLFRWK